MTDLRLILVEKAGAPAEVRLVDGHYSSAAMAVWTGHPEATNDELLEIVAGDLCDMLCNAPYRLTDCLIRQMPGVERKEGP